MSQKKKSGWITVNGGKMFQCHVCGSSEVQEKYITELFHIDDKPVMVEHIPAMVCVRCGEESFSRETTERIRQLVHGLGKPVRSLTMDVFAFVPHA